jgi:hypothetical protein
MAQLLRVYRHVFKINYFEVEPYQFGLDNPDGIASGAFWFYYRYGFRPLEPYLLQLAKKEAEKIASRKGYRTSSKTLIEFTGSNVGLKLGKTVSPKVADITSRVIHMIAKRFKGNRLTAETYCRQNFLTKTKWNASLSTEENEVLTEVSLWAEAKKVSKLEKLNLMVQMIHTKPKDVYAYQATLLSYFVD